MDRFENGMNLQKRKRTKGETLVETVVAFLVLSILMLMVTTAVKAGVSMNQRAIRLEESLENACMTAEQDAGTTLSEQAELRLTFAEGEVTIPLTVKQAGDDQVSITYFEKRSPRG